MAHFSNIVSDEINKDANSARKTRRDDRRARIDPALSAPSRREPHYLLQIGHQDRGSIIAGPLLALLLGCLVDIADQRRHPFNCTRLAGEKASYSLDSMLQAACIASDRTPPSVSAALYSSSALHTKA